MYYFSITFLSEAVTVDEGKPSQTKVHAEPAAKPQQLTQSQKLSQRSSKALQAVPPPKIVTKANTQPQEHVFKVEDTRAERQVMTNQFMQDKQSVIPTQPLIHTTAKVAPILTKVQSNPITKATQQKNNFRPCHRFHHIVSNCMGEKQLCVPVAFVWGTYVPHAKATQKETSF